MCFKQINGININHHKIGHADSFIGAVCARYNCKATSLFLAGVKSDTEER